MAVAEGFVVSVLMITYNHEKFIREAIESILSQETDFEYELVIANDHSNDKTEEVILKLIDEHPKKDSIRYFNHSSNIGMIPNFIFGLEQCNGKYTALCEGDDYWTDSLKLQKQVNFLENNREIALCFHRANVLNGGVLRLHAIPESKDGTYLFNELFGTYNFITTASVVFRNNVKPFPEWFKKVPYGDMALHYLITRNGKIACLPEIMSVYRIHEGGIWSGRKKMDAYFSEYNFYKILYPVLKGVEHQTLLMKADAIIRKITEERFPGNSIMQFFYKKYLKVKLS